MAGKSLIGNSEAMGPRGTHKMEYYRTVIIIDTHVLTWIRKVKKQIAK